MSQLSEEEKANILAKVHAKKLARTSETTIAPIEVLPIEEVEPKEVDTEFFSETDVAPTLENEFYEEEEESTAIAVQTPKTLSSVEGLQFASGMTVDQKALMYESISSYVGVTPKSLDSYIGQWLTCIGSVVQPIKVIDDTTGEERRWVKPIFKILDPEHHHAVIIAGGGKYGLEFARNMNELFGVGDWVRRFSVRINQEGRTGTNKETGLTEPRRMYRFEFKRLVQGE